MRDSIQDCQLADGRLPFVCARSCAHTFCLEAHDFEQWRPLKRRKPPRCETWAAFTGKTSENRLGDALQLGWIAPYLARAGQGIDGCVVKHLERVVLDRALAFVNRKSVLFPQSRVRWRHSGSVSACRARCTTCAHCPSLRTKRATPLTT